MVNILQFLDIDETFQHNKLSSKLQRICNSIVRIKWCWFHLKKNHILPSYGQKWHACPYLGIRFCGYFWTNWTDIFMGAQENIINRLMMINPSYDACFLFLIIGSLLVGKWATTCTRHPYESFAQISRSQHRI